MSKTIPVIIFAILMISLTVAADTLYHKNGTTIQGTIVEETPKYITFRTEEYGELRFERKDIEKIERGAGSPAPSNDSSGSSSSSNPFGATNPSGSSNPFGASNSSSGAGNPFGSPPSDSSSSSSPFGSPPSPSNGGTSNPFGTSSSNGGASSNPFGTSNSSGGAPVMNTDSASSGEMDNFGGDDLELPAAYQLAGISAPEVNGSVSAVSASGVALPLGAYAMMHSIAGNVRAKAPGDRWEVCQGSVVTAPGTEIWVGDGKAKLLMQGGAEAYITPSTNFMIGDESVGNSKVVLDIKSGRLWIHIAPNASVGVVEVNTPDFAASFAKGLICIGAEVGQYSRIAVVDGSVTGKNQTSQQTFNVSAGQAIVVSGELGVVSRPYQVDYFEKKEFNEWDVWAFQVHREVGDQYLLGAQAQNAIAGAASAAESRGALTTRVDDEVNSIKTAFLQFCIDTGRPVTTAEGYNALIYNPGESTWRGPYIKSAIPPMDAWGFEIKYELTRNAAGEPVGIVISPGPNGVYSNGRNDDIMAEVPYARHVK